MLLAQFLSQQFPKTAVTRRGPQKRNQTVEQQPQERTPDRSSASQISSGRTSARLIQISASKKHGKKPISAQLLVAPAP